jgi:hypothetical protein
VLVNFYVQGGDDMEDTIKRLKLELNIPDSQQTFTNTDLSIILLEASDSILVEMRTLQFYLACYKISEILGDSRNIEKYKQKIINRIL